ncbi:MAG: hypothetical protein P8M53_08355 [Pirellulales bacterium]|nr:hypothetical protein [Pirellulales bacterium]
MSQRFSILTILSLACLSPVFAIGKEDDGSFRSEKKVAAASDASGDVLLDSAIAVFDNYQSITANTRLQVHMRGHHLFGPGTYLQKGPTDRRQVRSEMVLRGRAGKFTFTQINDSNRLWLFEETPETSKLRLIDLQRLRDSGVLTENSLGKSTSFDALRIRGLAGLMKGIQDSFRFGRAVKIEWNEKSVWAMRGVWRDSMLKQMLGTDEGELKDSKWQDRLPHWAPTEIGLLLDAKTLFPYRFEFLTHIGDNPQGQSQLEPIAILELLEIRFDAVIDDSQFDRPSDIRPTDVTKDYLRKASKSTK